MDVASTYSTRPLDLSSSRRILASKLLVTWSLCCCACPSVGSPNGPFLTSFFYIFCRMCSRLLAEVLSFSKTKVFAGAFSALLSLSLLSSKLFFCRRRLLFCMLIFCCSFRSRSIELSLMRNGTLPSLMTLPVRMIIPYVNNNVKHGKHLSSTYIIIVRSVFIFFDFL
jgi:hypothetical protein